MDALTLRGGLVRGRRQDIAIRDGKIHRIGGDLDPAGHATINVADKLVLPGFIETHIHSDKVFFADRTSGRRDRRSPATRAKVPSSPSPAK